MKLLELFSGTGSVGAVWRDQHEVTSLDIDNRFAPEVCQSILEWDYKQHPTPDVIWSSPPCDQYSQARTTGGPRRLEESDRLVEKAWEIICYFRDLNPRLIWFMENGMTSLLWKREVSREIQPRVTLDYCMYGSPGYRKRTTIATNARWTPRRLCAGDCGNVVDGRHRMTAQRAQGLNRRGQRIQGDKCSLDTLHALPKALCFEILRVCVTNLEPNT